MGNILSGIAVLLASLVAAATWYTSRRQNQRDAEFRDQQARVIEATDGDRIRSEANDELIQNLRADNGDLRAAQDRDREQIQKLRADLRETRSELRETQAHLRQAEQKCESCQRRLDELRHDVYGPNFDPDRRPPPPPPDN